MTAAQVIRRTYAPSMLAGQVYARPYGSTAKPTPIGNVLALTLEHTEDAQTQPDLTRVGGGIHAEVRRVTGMTVSMTLADLNVTNLARAVLGTVAGVESGSVTAEQHTGVTKGSLLRLQHLNPTNVVVTSGTGEDATTIAAAGNYEVRPEGVFILENAANVTDDSTLSIAYEYGAYAVIEALTQSAVELELTFGGLNEADSGKPVLLEVWRCSQGVTSSLAMLQESGFGSLEVTGAVLQDPTKSGVGVSKYYRVSKA